LKTGNGDQNDARDKVDVDAFHIGIKTHWKSWKVEFGFERTVSNFESKRHVGSENKMCGLLTKLVRSRWLGIGQVFFACLWTSTPSQSINSQKGERGQYTAILTEQAWSIKNLLTRLSGKFFLLDVAGSSEWAR